MAGSRWWRRRTAAPSAGLDPPRRRCAHDSDGSVRQRPEFLDLAAADRGGILRSIPKSESRTKLSEWYPELCV